MLQENLNLKKNFFKIVEKFAEKCFVPISVGGGIRSIIDVKNLMNSGADKVVLNTGAIENNKLIKDISKSYGKQCVVLSVDTKKQKNKYIVMSNNGKIDTKLNVENWVKKAINLGAGEIILNTVEKDGSLEGFDLKLARRVSKISSVPVLIVGGAGNWQHFEEGLKTGVAGVCTQNIFHYTETSILSAKNYLLKKKIDIRK